MATSPSPEAPAEASPDISFAKGGKPKPPTLPGDCAVGQTVKWNGTVFVCSAGSISGWEIVQNTVVGDGTVACPTGKVVLGGGFTGTAGSVFDSAPIQIGPNNSGWSITQGHLAITTIYAICADGSA